MAPAPPSFVERITLLPIIGRIVFAFWFRLLSRPFLTGPHQKNVLKDALYALIRQSLASLSVAQEQYIYPSTAAVYKLMCGRNKIQPDVQTLKSGVKINWIGDRNAKKVLLFFHGGGYCLPCTPGHQQWEIDVQKAVGKDLAVAGLQYTLAPEKQYPGQLQEAVEALESLLVEQKRKPSSIFVGGDSAGGNLAMALISHLLHPHPSSQIKNLSKHITEPLAGAVLISPWVHWVPADGSAEVLPGSDIVCREVGERWSKAIIGSSPTDSYQEAAIAETTWFEQLPTVAKDIFIWGGGAEMLIDSIQRFAKLIKSVHKNTEYVEQPGAGHEDFITCRTLHLPQADDHSKLIEAWLAARL